MINSPIFSVISTYQQGVL